MYNNISEQQNFLQKNPKKYQKKKNIKILLINIAIMKEAYLF